MFVEWELTSDITTKCPRIARIMKCDICYAPMISANERSRIVAIGLRRRQMMHEKWWEECDKSHLDTVHREWLKRGVSAYYAHTLSDKGEPLYQSVDRTDS